MQRCPCLLLMMAGLVMALIKLYERRERARFATTYQVMLPMDRHKWPDADAGIPTMPLTFETKFTAVNSWHRPPMCKCCCGFPGRVGAAASAKTERGAADAGERGELDQHQEVHCAVSKTRPIPQGAVGPGLGADLAAQYAVSPLKHSAYEF